MSEKNDFFAIPGIVPALVVDAVGVLLGLALIFQDRTLFGVMAIALGATPLVLVLVRHSASRRGGSQ
ncbi:MAG TPA: hypothetical protein VD978_08285 [Azospirillum sp.]|nr:hypothetical protein [Azospirillum sp.]